MSLLFTLHCWFIGADQPDFRKATTLWMRDKRHLAGLPESRIGYVRVLRTRIQGEVQAMATNDETNRTSSPAKAAEEVAGAQDLLRALQKKIGQHPEIGQAIHKLELALAILEVQTGGML